MSSLIERFNQDLPEWLWDIKQESFKKIWQSKLLNACKDADKKAMKTLMIRFWPFVDEFPEIILRHQWRISAKEFFHHPFSALFLVDKVSKILADVRGDEKNHKLLWLDTAFALDLDEEDLYLGEDFYGKTHKKVQATIDKVGESVSIFGNKVSSSVALLRLAAVEIIAEGISLYVKNEFKNISNSSSRWFEVHIYHKEGVMSHEEMVYRLAFAFDEKRIEKDIINKIIQEVVDLFIEAGEAPF